MKPIKVKNKKFKLAPRYVHLRSEGLTSRRNKGSQFQQAQISDEQCNEAKAKK